MRYKDFTPKEIEDNFNRYLQDAIDIGRAVPSDMGLDTETSQAINAVAEAFPNTDARLIQNARKEFAKQLDGTHRDERRSEWSDWVETRYNS